MSTTPEQPSGPLAAVVSALLKQADECRRAGCLTAAMAYEADAALLESTIKKPSIPEGKN